MAEFIATIGLPASGKDTWAREEMTRRTELGEKIVRVNRDDLRLLLHVGEWNPDKEALTRAARDSIINTLLRKGVSVISTDTNFGNLQYFGKIAGRYRANFVVKDFTEVPVLECVRRDALRTGTAHVGEQVIRNMAKKAGLV